MLVDKKLFFEKDGSLAYHEAIFDSSNILKTTYFPKFKRLYIAFKRGHTYSYSNITEELYHEFENAKSQGDLFNEKIKSRPNEHVYRKEFTLYPDEVNQLNEVVENNKNNIHQQKEIKNLDLINQDYYPNEIIFRIGDQETIKIDKDGFYWKGEMVEVDMEIYEKFNEWLDHAHNEIKK